MPEEIGYICWMDLHNTLKLKLISYFYGVPKLGLYIPRLSIELCCITDSIPFQCLLIQPEIHVCV